MNKMTKEEFLELFPKIRPEQYVYRELFAHNSEERMANVLERYLKKK